jgi:hypothetical protein
MRLKDKTTFYAGTYDVNGDRVIHHVMISNTARDGFELTRIVRFEGNSISLTTIEPPPKTLIDNTEAGDTSRLVWERVQ